MPDTLSAADFVSIRPQYKNEQAEGELPAAVEHLFAQGTMIDHYFVRPALALFEDQTFADFGRISAMVFCQQEGGAPWVVHFQEPTMVKDLAIDMPDAEFRAMLAASSVTLPGEG